MDERFISDRLAALRTAKGISARNMSLSIGQSPNYINKIESRKALPSMGSFLYICDYLNITPQEFFDEGNPYPERLSQLVKDLKKLDSTSLSTISALVKKITSSQ